MRTQRLRIGAAVAAVLALALALGMAGCAYSRYEPSPDELAWASPRAAAHMQASGGVLDAEDALAGIPDAGGSAYVELNGNVPEFSSEQLRVNKGLEVYGGLDALGRCTFAYACVGEETMPTEQRGDIHEIHPSGWKQRSYDFIEGGVLYNRCHLIAHVLTAEDANETNLVTGTRFMNTEGMEPFEGRAAECVWHQHLHVAYRATPVFAGGELVCRGVQIEAQSIEDGGRALSFNVFCPNVQPGVTIDYASGRSEENGEAAELGLDYSQAAEEDSPATYVLNEHSMKFHRLGCESVADIAPENRRDFTGQRSYLIEQGYEPCGACNP